MGDHVLRDAISAPGNPDGANSDSCDAAHTPDDATGHVERTSEPDRETGPRCVAWKDSATGRTEWCATLRNAHYDPDALHDSTACGYVVTMRIGSEERDPTCEECAKRVAKRHQGGAK